MENNLGTGTDAARGSDAAQPANIKDTAARGAQSLVDRAEKEARSRIDAGKKDAALTLSSVASTLLQSSSNLKDDQQNLAGEYVEKAAEQIDRLAQYIQNADPGEVVENVERFARRRPALFIGAAFAVGVIGARFLKSSRRGLDESQRLNAPGFADRQMPTPMSYEDASPSGLSGTSGAVGASNVSGPTGTREELP